MFSTPVEIYLFGSRADDARKGGDIDIMIKTTETVESPAVVAARVSARLNILLGGRKVDVIIASPSLMHQTIHDVAQQQGVRL